MKVCRCVLGITCVSNRTNYLALPNKLVKYKRLKDPKTNGVYRNYVYPHYIGVPFNPETDEYPYPVDAIDMTYDGLHPSDKGYDVIANMIMKVMKKLWKPSIVWTWDVNYKDCTWFRFQLLAELQLTKCYSILSVVFIGCWLKYVLFDLGWYRSWKVSRVAVFIAALFLTYSISITCFHRDGLPSECMIRPAKCEDFHLH